MMSSVDMEMEEIFEERDEGGLEEDMHQSATMPDLDLNIPDGDDLTQTQGDGEGDAEVLAKLQGAAKKKNMKPQPKLDPTRLKGDRGLPILPKVFERIKFKGRGHETEDLQLVMRKLEHWGHRLFPKLPFDDLIERMEKLGSKKEVQNTVKRIRLDMPILDEDHTAGQQEDADGEQNADGANAQEPVENAEDLFDELIRQEREAQHPTADADDDVSPPASPVYSRRAAADADQVDTPVPAPVHTPARSAVNTPKTPVSESQKERMEKNRRMALEKRAKRMGMTLEAYEDHIAQQKKASVAATTPTTAKDTDSQSMKGDQGTLEKKQDKHDKEDNQAEYSLAEPTNDAQANEPSVASQNVVTDQVKEDGDDMQTVDEIMDILDDDADAGEASAAVAQEGKETQDSRESEGDNSNESKNEATDSPVNKLGSCEKPSGASCVTQADEDAEEETMGTLLLEDVTPDRDTNDHEHTDSNKDLGTNKSPVKSLKDSLQTLQCQDNVTDNVQQDKCDSEDVEMADETQDVPPTNVEDNPECDTDNMDITDHSSKLTNHTGNAGHDSDTAVEIQASEIATSDVVEDCSQSLSILS